MTSDSERCPFFLETDRHQAPLGRDSGSPYTGRYLTVHAQGDTEAVLLVRALTFLQGPSQHEGWLESGGWQKRDKAHT